MHLPARLSASTLGDLLGALHRDETTGLLELREIRGPRGRTVLGRVHGLHLRAGLVAGVDTAFSVPPLGELLRRDGIVTDEALSVLVRRIRAGDFRRTGEILANDGLATEDMVRAGLRRQLRERVEAVFTLEDAGVSFHTARPSSNAVRIVPLAAKEFLHGRPRARDRRAPPRPEPPRCGLGPMLGGARNRALRMLRVSEEAGTDEIRRAFRKLASLLHPDRLGVAPAHERRAREVEFAELSAAYHLLLA